VNQDAIFLEILHKNFVGTRRRLVRARFQTDPGDKPGIAKCIENLETLLYEFATYPRSPQETSTRKRLPPRPAASQNFLGPIIALFTSLALTNAHQTKRAISPGKDHCEL